MVKAKDTIFFPDFVPLLQEIKKSTSFYGVGESGEIRRIQVSLFPLYKYQNNSLL